MKRIFFLVCSVVILTSCEKKEDLVTSFEHSTVADCQGNEYATVKIGNQWWMAENLKCNMYDTESNKAGQVIPGVTTLLVYTPTCFVILPTTISNVSNGVNYSINLTANQRTRLGGLYNWAAALGLADGQVDTVFVEPQQGICPNGWHIPSGTEWSELINYINKNGGGKFKEPVGWFDNNDSTATTPAFAVLPAGYSRARTINSLGFSTSFISSTGTNALSAGSYYFSYNNDGVMSFSEVKNYGISVRCVKND